MIILDLDCVLVESSPPVLKPRTEQFMKLVLSSGHVVCVWTTAHKKSVENIIKCVFKARAPDFFMSREDCLIYEQPNFIYDKLIGMGYNGGDMIFIGDAFRAFALNSGARYIDSSLYTLSEIWMLIYCTDYIPIKDDSWQTRYYLIIFVCLSILYIINA